MRIIYTFLLSLMLLGQSEASHPALIQAEFVFSAPPTPSCHSATLTETPSGDLLCAWFGGLQEGEKDVAIWLSTLHASQWNPPQKVASEQDIPCWNPVLFTMPSGEILLFYKAG
jgi:predicted neuraminidase